MNHHEAGGKQTLSCTAGSFLALLVPEVGDEICPSSCPLTPEYSHRYENHRFYRDENFVVVLGLYLLR
jgi:hypothetical protein